MRDLRSGPRAPAIAPIEAVLFDWGDTLFYPPDPTTLILEVARERGVSMSASEARTLWEDLWAAGKTPDEVASGRDLSREQHRASWTKLFARADARVPGLSPRLYELMDPYRWTPYVDTKPTLEALRARDLPIGLVSNHAYDLRDVFAARGLRDLIDVYVLSFEKGVAKPSPRLFEIAAQEIGALPERTLMVGDHPEADGTAAAAAGLQTFILPPWSGSGPRGLVRVVELVDESREGQDGSTSRRRAK